MKWVTIKKAAELSGYTEKAIEAKRADGTWLEGVIWRSTSGRVEVDTDAVDAWVEGRIPGGVRRFISALRARPRWADRSAIARVYASARSATAATGIPHNVDHIIPLNNREVCGLHVPANLRVITCSENSRKSNRWTDEWRHPHRRASG